jgi:hypothetical protein
MIRSKFSLQFCEIFFYGLDSTDRNIHCNDFVMVTWDFFEIEIFFRSKNKAFGPVQIMTPKTKLFLKLFLRFLGDFVLVPKAKKW